MKKNQNTKKQKWILAIIIVLIVIGITVFFIVKNVTEKTKPNTDEKYVYVEKDGTKKNISKELKKAKEFDGLQVKNIQVESINNLTTIIADVYNPTDTAKGDYVVNLRVLDETGKEIITIAGYLNYVKGKETTQLKIKTSLDFANAYDFEIVKL